MTAFQLDTSGPVARGWMWSGSHAGFIHDKHRKPEVRRDTWAQRQLGKISDFPPIVPYLGDDGLVYLRETAR